MKKLLKLSIVALMLSTSAFAASDGENELSKKNSHISKEITIHSKNNDCKLNLYMIINNVYFHKKQYIINNPSFELL